MKNMYTKTKILTFNSEYASEVLTTIPAGYINKKVCGCGLSSVALENKENIILAVPNVVLIDNKVEQYPNKRCAYYILGVKYGVERADIDEYVKECQALNRPIKVMVTYDSLWKCEHLLDTCRLIIDESDKIIGYASLKCTNDSKVDVMTYMLALAEKHKDTVAFISATPVPIEYLPQWISEIDQIEMNWENTGKAVPIILKRRNPLASLKNEIIYPIQTLGKVTVGDKTFKSAIIFLNTVEGILKVIKEAGIEKEDVTIICSDNSRNDVKIRGYKRQVGAHIKTKFVFVTSSGFQGIDLYAEDSMSIVVSNSKVEHLMVNASLDLKQAISRNRCKSNSCYGRFIFIYNQTIFDKSEEELIKLINNTEKRIKNNVKDLCIKSKTDLEMYEDTLETYLQSVDFSKYAHFKDEWELNTLVFNADRFFILEIRKQYTTGFDLVSSIDADEVIIIDKPEYNKECSYKVVLANYKLGKCTKAQKLTEHYELIYNYYCAFKTFTDNSAYAKSRLDGLKSGGASGVFKADIQKHFAVGNRYSLKYCKEALQKLYNLHGIQRKAKATDMNEWFVDIRNVSTREGKMIEIIKK